MNSKTMRLLALCGAIVPISVLVRRIWHLSNSGFFGFLLPTIAAAGFILILIYQLVAKKQ